VLQNNSKEIVQMPNRLPDRVRPDDVLRPGECLVLMNVPKAVSVWSGRRLVGIPAGIQYVPAHLSSDPYLLGNGATPVNQSPAPVIPSPVLEEPAFAPVEEPRCTTVAPATGGEGAAGDVEPELPLGVRLDYGGERGEVTEYVNADNEIVSPTELFGPDPVPADVEPVITPAPVRRRGRGKKA
jgi:hypothetical protein